MTPVDQTQVFPAGSAEDGVRQTSGARTARLDDSARLDSARLLLRLVEELSVEAPREVRHLAIGRFEARAKAKGGEGCELHLSPPDLRD